MARITKRIVILLAVVAVAALVAVCINHIEHVRHVEGIVANLGGANAAKREAALAELSAIKDPDEISILVSHLSDNDDSLRSDLSVALVRIGQPAVKPLVANIRSFYSRWRAVRSFVRERMKPEAQWERLENLEAKGMWASAYVLRLIGRPAVGPLSALARDRNAFVRAAAAQVLGALPDQAAVPSLAAAVQDADDNVEMRAVTYLVSRPEDEAAQALAARAVSGDEWSRFWQGLEYSRLNDRKGIPFLIWELKNGGAPTWRRDAAYALGPFADDAVAVALEGALSDKDRDVRLAALDRLSRLDTACAREAFRKVAESTDATLRFEADQVAKPAGKAAPLSRYNSDMNYARRIAPMISIFDRVGAEARRSILLHFCQDEDDSRVVDFLLTVAQDARENASVRAMGVWALRFSRDKRVVPVLITALSDKEAQVREMAERALSRMPPQQTMPALTKALENAGGGSNDAIVKIIEEAKKQNAGE